MRLKYWAILAAVVWLAVAAAGRAAEPATNDTILCEAEEFKVEKPGWRAMKWGENYYASTFANTFLSRKAFLGAPEQCDETVARYTADIKIPGRYLVLVRYEAAYRFETQFKVQVEQAGHQSLNRLYGARDNIKIWPFGNKLQKEVALDWGAVENIVWEGQDVYVDLKPGPVILTLIAGHQPEPAAKRNVDVLMLTTDDAQVKMRIEKEQYLPLDGMLTQAGDVWLKIHNTSATTNTVKSLMFPGGPWEQHSPYWVHLRNWKPVVTKIGPEATSEWIEVGSDMDTLNDGLWGFSSTAPCQLEFGLRDAAGKIESLRTFTVNGQLRLLGRADTRYSRQIGTPEEATAELTAYLDKIAPYGRTPTLTPIYAVCGIPDAQRRFGFVDESKGANVYVDWRRQSLAQLEAKCQKLSADQRKAIGVVSLGDEISLPVPTGAAAAAGFAAYLKEQGVPASEIGTAAQFSVDAKLKTTQPAVYYWSRRYQNHFGRQMMKDATDVIRKYCPQAGVGANYSPHGTPAQAFLGNVSQWVTTFRDDALTLPWSEDYVWQVPVASPQMNEISLDLFRAGIRGKPDRKILMYVMPHWPGNTPSMWRRLFYGDLAHGMKMVDLFEFQPVWMAYTENHCSLPETYAIVKRALHELGLFEDIIQAGHVCDGQVALWFSETGDIWDDNNGSFGPAKSALYLAVRQQQVPLDIVIEGDSLDAYRVLYLTDQHVSEAASKKIADWVRRGGRLFVTAGAGAFDEYNQPNKILLELIGRHDFTIEAPADKQVGFLKQDLPFATPVATLEWHGSKIPAYGAVALTHDSPVTVREAGKGQVTVCSFLPSLTWLKPAIPLKPVDRGSTDDAMAHFMPINFDPAMTELIGSPCDGLVRPVQASVPMVETTVIESPKGVVIPVVNWTGKPVAGLQLTINRPLPGKNITLASGAKISTKTDKDALVLTFDLDVADAVIVR
jgi:hypothetical protein